MVEGREQKYHYFHKMTNAHRSRSYVGRIKINGFWHLNENATKEGVVRAF